MRREQSGWESDLYARSGFFDNDKMVAEYTSEELDLLLYSEPRTHTGLPYNTYEGLVVKFNRKFINRVIQILPERTRRQVEPFLKLGPCPLCKGARLNQAALRCKVKEYTSLQAAIRLDTSTGRIASFRLSALTWNLRKIAQLGFGQSSSCHMRPS